MKATASSFKALSNLLRYARGYRGRVLLATFSSILNKLFDVMPEILIGVAIDVVIRREQSFVADLGVVDPFNQILLLGILTILIWGFESLFEYFQMILWRNLAQQIQHDLRLDAYGHLQDLDMEWYEESSTGNLVAILNDDVNQMERFLDGGANELIQILTAVIAIGSVFFVLSPVIALMAFTPMPLILVGAFWFQRRAQPLYASVRERVGLLSARLANNISGIATIKSFTREKHELSQLQRDSEAYLEANRRAIRVSSAFIPIIRMGILLGFMATLLYGGKLTLDGELNAGAYGVLVFLTQRLLWPLTRLAATVDLFERAMASTRRVLGLLKTPIRIREGEQVLDKNTVRGEIEFRDLFFRYSKGPMVLENINLHIRAGESIALVGQTGSGKSTLVKLLLRFYQPDSGQVLLDEHDTSALQLSSLRGAIGLVSQDVYLFHGNVRENIAYGRPQSTAEEIENAARAAEAHEFIRKLPEGYDTVIGERGQKLSGGQRQRISIARAVLKDPPILVLDEATSSVDNETEAAIQRSMLHISAGRTTLVIAHRLSTIVSADRIYVMDKGRIVEQGRHADLMENNGIYAALWQVQTGAGQGPG
jgi:ATP-binding cassette subfamily B protein